MDSGNALFHTASGPCAIAWSARGLTRVELPGRSVRAERGTARPPWVCDAIRLLAQHLGGKPQDLSSIPVDLADAPAFHRRAYEALRAVPPGQTLTYGQLAVRAGAPGAARAVGQAMARNQCLLVVPCHRVLAAGGKAGGFSAAGGVHTKARLLALEGVQLGRALALR